MWVCLFTCLGLRAVHFALVDNSEKAIALVDSSEYCVTTVPISWALPKN